MKQGRAPRRYDGYKVEPRPRALIPAGVAEIGIAQGNHVTEQGETGYHGVGMHQGRGFKAPRNANQTTHKAGSQGRS